MFRKKVKPSGVVMSQTGNRISDPVKGALWFTGDIQRRPSPQLPSYEEIGKTAIQPHIPQPNITELPKNS